MANPNLYAAEIPIIERLRAVIGCAATVDSASLLNTTEDPTAYCPGVFLMAGPTAGVVDALRGQLAKGDQQWQVSVIVVHHNGTNAYSATRAGELQALVLDALLGFEPTAQYLPLRYLASGAPIYHEAGFAEFPLTFQTTVVVKRP